MGREGAARPSAGRRRRLRDRLRRPGDRLRREARRAVGDPRVFAEIQRALRGSLHARLRVDRGLDRAFSLLGVPSHGDLLLLQRRIDGLMRRITALRLSIEDHPDLRSGS